MTVPHTTTIHWSSECHKAIQNPQKVEHSLAEKNYLQLNRYKAFIDIEHEKLKTKCHQNINRKCTIKIFGLTYSIRKTWPSFTERSDFFLNAPGGRMDLFSPGSFCALGNKFILVRTRCSTEFGGTFCAERDLSSSSSFPQ